MIVFKQDRERPMGSTMAAYQRSPLLGMGKGGMKYTREIKNVLCLFKNTYYICVCINIQTFYNKFQHLEWQCSQRDRLTNKNPSARHGNLLVVCHGSRGDFPK